VAGGKETRSLDTTLTASRERGGRVQGDEKEGKSVFPKSISSTIKELVLVGRGRQDVTASNIISTIGHTNGTTAPTTTTSSSTNSNSGTGDDSRLSPKAMCKELYGERRFFTEEEERDPPLLLTDPGKEKGAKRVAVANILIRAVIREDGCW